MPQVPHGGSEQSGSRHQGRAQTAVEEKLAWVDRSIDDVASDHELKKSHKINKNLALLGLPAANKRIHPSRFSGITTKSQREEEVKNCACLHGPEARFGV